jgi:hypothetical protein
MEKAVQQFVQRPPGVGKAVQQFVQRPPGVGKVVQQFVQRPPCYMYSGSMKYPPTHAWGRRCTGCTNCSCTAWLVLTVASVRISLGHDKASSSF